MPGRPVTEGNCTDHCDAVTVTVAAVPHPVAAPATTAIATAALIFTLTVPPPDPSSSKPTRQTAAQPVSIDRDFDRTKPPLLPVAQ